MENTLPIVGIRFELILQMINFVLLVGIFKVFFFKPIAKIIEKRRLQIEKDVDAAKNDKEEAKGLKAVSDKELKETKRKVHEIMIDAQKKAEVLRDEIMKETHATREKMLKAAEAEATKMKEQAKRELRDEMTGIAIKLAEKMVREKMNKEVENRLLDEFIEEVGEAK